MRIFNQLAFEGYISGTSPVYSDAQHDALLGAADQLTLGGYTSQVTGSGPPNITVQVEHSFDNVRWITRNATAEINQVTLSTTAETNVQGQDGNPNTRPALAFARLRISLGGTTPTGQVRIWAAGRDRAEG